MLDGADGLFSSGTCLRMTPKFPFLGSLKYFLLSFPFNERAFLNIFFSFPIFPGPLSFPREWYSSYSSPFVFYSLFFSPLHLLAVTRTVIFAPKPRFPSLAESLFLMSEPLFLSPSMLLLEFLSPVSPP